MHLNLTEYEQDINHELFEVERTLSNGWAREARKIFSEAYSNYEARFNINLRELMGTYEFDKAQRARIDYAADEELRHIRAAHMRHLVNVLKNRITSLP